MAIDPFDRLRLNRGQNAVQHGVNGLIIALVAEDDFDAVQAIIDAAVKWRAVLKCLRCAGAGCQECGGDGVHRP